MRKFTYTRDEAAFKESQKTLIKRAMERHTLRRYICKGCGMEFMSREGLKVHTRKRVCRPPPVVLPEQLTLVALPWFTHGRDRAIAEMPLVRKKRYWKPYKQGELTLEDPMQFPSTREVAAELLRINNEVDGECDVRLQVYDNGTWLIHFGDASYDSNHHGFWGSSSIPGGTAAFDAGYIADDLLEQVQDDYYQTHPTCNLDHI